jgi:hypothetical protein
MTNALGPVTIDGMLTVTASYDPTDRWNGFITTPYVTREQAERIAAWLRGDPGEMQHIHFDGDVLVLTTLEDEEPEQERVEPVDGLYPVGFGWVWTEAEEDTLATSHAPDVDATIKVEVLRDGKVLTTCADANAAFAWLQRHQCMSVDWAIRHEGYSMRQVTA